MKRNAKVNKWIVFLSILGIVLVSSAVTGIINVELGSDRYTAYIDFPIPQFYITHIESLPEVERVSVSTEGYSVIQTNIPVQNSQQIADINAVVFKTMAYIISVEGNDLEGTPFQDLNVPFLCPVDEVTGIKYGIHLRNGLISLTPNDGACNPSLN